MEIQPDLSICLVPDQPGADLGPCLEALFACTDPLSLEVFVPQGAGCTDFGNSTHLHFVDHSGSSTAFVKEAWNRAQGRYLGLWHSRVIATPASLFTLVEFLDDHPDAAVAGPRFLDREGEILTTAFGRNKLMPGADLPMPGWDGLSTMEVDWLSSAALVINRLAWEDVTLPASSLGGLWERCLCTRLQRQGWHIFFVHLARVTSPASFCHPPTLWQRLVDFWQQMQTAGVDR